MNENGEDHNNSQDPRTCAKLDMKDHDKVPPESCLLVTDDSKLERLQQNFSVIFTPINFVSSGFDDTVNMNIENCQIKSDGSQSILKNINPPGK